MNVLQNELLNHLLNCHPKIRGISNVMCEKISIELGSIPVFLACCYEMSLKLLESRDTEILIVHDVSYQTESKEDGFIVSYTVFKYGRNDGPSIFNCIDKYQEKSKEHCLICSEKLNTTSKEGKCIRHRCIPASDLDTLQSCLPDLELALYKIIEEIGD